MDNFVSTVETRKHDVILAAMDSLVNPRVERAKRSTNACFLQDPGSVIPNPEKMISQEIEEAFIWPLRVD